jgi:hypothetical protein
MHIFDWLIADFSDFGLRIQYWMPVFAFIFAILVFLAWLDHRRFRKKTRGGLVDKI